MLAVNSVVVAEFAVSGRPPILPISSLLARAILGGKSSQFSSQLQTNVNKESSDDTHGFASVLAAIKIVIEIVAFGFDAVLLAIVLVVSLEHDLRAMQKATRVAVKGTQISRMKERKLQIVLPWKLTNPRR